MFSQMTLIGNVGQDPEVKILPNGNTVVNFSVAHTARWTDKQTNEKKERTEWFRICAFGPLAENIAEYVAKGSLLFVTGEMRNEQWTNKEGVTQYGVKLYADQVRFLSRSETRPQQEAPAARPQKPAAPAVDDFDDDIPF